MHFEQSETNGSAYVIGANVGAKNVLGIETVIRCDWIHDLMVRWLRSGLTMDVCGFFPNRRWASRFFRRDPFELKERERKFQHAFFLLRSVVKSSQEKNQTRRHFVFQKSSKYRFLLKKEYASEDGPSVGSRRRVVEPPNGCSGQPRLSAPAWRSIVEPWESHRVASARPDCSRRRSAVGGHGPLGLVCSWQSLG